MSLTANKLTQEQFIEKATLLHNGFYNYNKVHYVNARTNIDIICPLHGLFHQQPQVHLRGGGCPECKKLKVSQNRLSNTQTFIKKANVLWDGLYDYSKVEYKSATDKVIVGCRIHGDFQITPHNHLSGYGCHKCAVENRAKLKRTSKEIFIKQVNEIHHNKFDYSKVEYSSLHEDI